MKSHTPKKKKLTCKADLLEIIAPLHCRTRQRFRQQQSALIWKHSLDSETNPVRTTAERSRITKKMQSFPEFKIKYEPVAVESEEGGLGKEVSSKDSIVERILVVSVSRFKGWKSEVTASPTPNVRVFFYYLCRQGGSDVRVTVWVRKATCDWNATLSFISTLDLLWLRSLWMHCLLYLLFSQKYHFIFFWLSKMKNKNAIF